MKSNLRHLALVGFFLASFACLPLVAHTTGVLMVEVLDVCQGDAILLRRLHNHTPVDSGAPSVCPTTELLATHPHALNMPGPRVVSPFVDTQTRVAPPDGESHEVCAHENDSL